MATVEAYPLHWPQGWARTERMIGSAFYTGFGKARNYLLHELKLLGARNVIISSNVPLNKTDGLPRANFTPDDPAVAVYFNYKDKAMVFACDKYNRMCDNMHAIGKTIEAIRGIQRWGASDMMERAFTGFKALPAKAEQGWRYWLGFGEEQIVTPVDVDRAFRELAKTHHPDAGGTAERFMEIQQARENARRDLGAADVKAGS